MPPTPSERPHRPAVARAAAWVLDLLLAALAAIWLAGGVEWSGRVILGHGPDLRRAALIVGMLGWAAWPPLRERSLWLRAARWAWESLKAPRGRRLALVGAWLAASAVSALQALALRAPLYDVGIFHQIIWALSRGHGFVSTISGAGNFLLDHFSPSLAVVVPTFWLSGASPLTLPLLQPALLFGGASAWVWLAARAPGTDAPSRATLAAAATVFVVGFDSLWGNVHWGFHENALAFAALSWAFALLFAEGGAFGAAMTRRRRLGVLALFLLAAFSKEILLVDVAVALGLWAWAEGRRGRAFALSILGVAAGMLLVFVGFELMPHPADKNYFDRYYSYLGRDLGTFFRTLLLSPWEVVRHVGAGELGRYFLVVFLPWLFIPLRALARDPRRGAWLLAALPSLASAALATYPPLRGNGFHYVLELWPVLAAITVAGLAGLRSPRAAAAWALLSLLAWSHDPWGQARDHWAASRRQAAARSLLAAIPPGASVSADELAGTWVAGRERVTRWPALAPFGGRCPEWVVARGREQSREAPGRCGASPVSITRTGDWHLLRFAP